MESLMCDEVLDFSSLSAASPPPAAAERPPSFVHSTAATAAVSSRNDFEEAVGFLVEKEMSYMPKPGYVNLLQSNALIYHARQKAISWIIQVQKSLSVSMETVFYAANYLDRFISLNKCQMEGLGHPPFGSNMFGRMETSLLQGLEWKLLSTTTYSYLQLTETLQDELKTRATHILLQTLLDPKFIEFRPSLVAESVLQCILNPQEKDQYFYHFSALIPQVEKDDMMKKIHEMVVEAATWEKKEEYCSGDCAAFLTLQLEETTADLKNIDGSTRKRRRDT
nr:putative cyclin-D7-1 [Ipomoea batatas]